jgi:hypothetical protein
MKCLVLGSIFIFATAATVLADSPAPRDFACGQMLTANKNEALHELPLPVDAYLWARQPGLADLRVFNNDGELVPAILLPSPVPPLAPAITRPLRLFPVMAAPSGGAGGMALHARTDRNGTIVTLNTSQSTAGEKPPAVYIVDATSFEQQVAGMELNWETPPRNYLGTVTISTSDDLRNWKPLAAGPVASLRQGSEILEQHTVEFPSVRSKYFRLILAPEQDIPRITGVTARLATATVEPARLWRSLATVPGKDRAGDYHFDTGGQLPVDRIRVHFPESNTMVRARFYSRPNDKSSWALRHCTLLYHLRQGGTELVSPAATLPSNTDRHWVMRIEQDGGGIGTGLPLVEVGWLPHRLVFVARGSAPYLLAYGSGRDDLSPLRDDALLTGLHPDQRDQLRPAPASAAPRQELGGKEAFRTRIPPTTWKKLLLWGILALGVALLAGMAWRLQREMNGERHTDL